VNQTAFIRRRARAGAWLVFFLWCSALASPGRDVFVMLSGGDSPLDNNYSQYLQASAMVNFLQQNYPRNSVWVFFGAGNRKGAPVLSDVFRQVKRDGRLVDTWLPGDLPNNRPATREEFLPALRREILPAVAGGGTLFLFVGDHGSRTRGAEPESEITLWGLHRDNTADHGWDHRDNESLGVAELGGIFAAGLGKGRVVFCMTQCHSGGFHFLAMAHDLAPDRQWFTAPPSWLRHLPPQVSLRVAGFSATDEFSLASGCDPSPDPDEWAGYERYLPEHLLGLNLFTLQHAGSAMRSFAEAHDAAVLVDDTIDKPCSTSEQYLECWATLIETHLVRESDLTPPVKRAVAEFERTVNGAKPKLADAAFSERQAQFDRFIGQLAKRTGNHDLLASGTRAELEDAIDPPEPQSSSMNPGGVSTEPPGPAPMERGPAQGRGRRGGPGGRVRPWSQTIRPAWTAAVQAGQVTNLPPDAVDFEEHVLNLERRGNNYFSGGPESLRDEVYWQGGYGDPKTMDPKRADAVSLWAAERRDQIIAWARASDSTTVRTAAERLAQLVPPAPSADAMDQADQAILKMTAADRTLFYRRVLAAWQFLLAVNDKPALARLKELTDLERTPLPRGK
jgi:hypothetical protein